jgi:hypothetical protein
MAEARTKQFDVCDLPGKERKRMLVMLSKKGLPKNAKVGGRGGMGKGLGLVGGHPLAVLKTPAAAGTNNAVRLLHDLPAVQSALQEVLSSPVPVVLQK